MCWKCGNDITQSPVTRTTECFFCGKDLHCCRNCVYFAPGSHFDCHETVEENVTDKEKANFCDSFKVKNTFSKINGGDDKALKARAAFDALFS